ncbi:hypothetical protein BDZ89DRAFT_1072123 [Hymenopellis radicata]|nr:hypothetical protein BDZ89DRAFT_1072123 [Hymenopellis radicata]
MSSHAARSKLDSRVGWDLFRRSTAGLMSESALGNQGQGGTTYGRQLDWDKCDGPMMSTVSDGSLTRSWWGLSPEAHDKGTRGR